MPLQKVIFYKNGRDLAEIYQSVAMKFSFASIQNKNIIQCHEWVKCRDFLHDVVKCALTKKTSKIYNFSYVPDKNPLLDLERTTLLVSQKGLKCGKEFEANLRTALELINHYETIIGEKLSFVEQVVGDTASDYKYVWKVIGPKFWITEPFLISMYTFLLRLGCKNIKFNNKNELEEAFNSLISKNKGSVDNDIKYLISIREKLELSIIKYPLIIKKNKEGFSDLYFTDIPIGSFHDKSGIVSTCTGKSWSEKLNNSTNLLMREN